VKFSNISQKESDSECRFIESTLPTFDVKVGLGKDSSSDWMLFTKAGSSLVPFTQDYTDLDHVWIQNVCTKGFLSVRSNEGWTAPGKAWTRGQEPQPSGAFSWERFQIQRVGAPTKSGVVKENELLHVQLHAAQFEIQRLKAELQQYEEYKAFFFAVQKTI